MDVPLEDCTFDAMYSFEAVRGGGFEIIRAIDQQAEQGDPERPWYAAL